MKPEVRTETFFNRDFELELTTTIVNTTVHIDAQVLHRNGDLLLQRLYTMRVRA